MVAFRVFLIRLILATILAFLLCRLFFPGASWARVMALGAIMFILAYLFEYTKRKDRG